MTETSLLTPEDIEIQKKIEARTINRSINKFHEPKYFKEFRQFRKFIERLEIDAAIGLHYDCQNKTKTCLKCGEVLPIGSSLASHNQRCGIIKIYDEKGNTIKDNLNKWKRIQRSRN